MRIGWRWEHKAWRRIHGTLSVYAASWWLRVGVRSASYLRFLACVYTLLSTVQSQFGNSKLWERFANSIGPPPLVNRTRNGWLSWCVKECLVGEAQGVENPPVPLQRTFITIVAAATVIEEGELPQFWPVKLWKLAALVRGSPCSQHLAQLSSHWVAPGIMQELMHISLCFSPKFQRRTKRGRHWFLRRIAQRAAKGSSQWGSHQMQWIAQRAARESAQWERRQLLWALREESILSPPPNFEVPSSQPLRRIPWLCGKAFQRDKDGAELWKKSQRISSQRRSCAFASFSQVGFKVLVNFNFLFYIVVCVLHVAKSCSRLPQSQWARSLLFGTWFMALLVFCLFMVMLSVYTVCLGHKSFWKSPCVGCYGATLETLSVLLFDLFAKIALRGKCMSRLMPPMEPQMALGSQLPWM